MINFKTVENTVKETIESISHRDENWNWNVKVDEDKVVIHWGYFDYVEEPNANFTIQEIEFDEASEPVIRASNEHGETIAIKIIGQEFYQDGDLRHATIGLMLQIEEIAHKLY